MMAQVQVSPPKQWEDWLNWLMGIWLCLSPWALRFENDHVATRTAVISGVVLIFAEVVTLSIYRAWEEWINVIIGAWLIVSSWVLRISEPMAKQNLVIVGLLVTALALYEIWDARRNPGAE
jgi:hypothetical protein